MATTNPFPDPQSQFQSNITKTLKRLFEEKHLYQNLTIDIEKEREAAQKKEPNALTRSRLLMLFNKIVGQKWTPIDPVESLPFTPDAITTTFQIPDIKLYCENCDREEAYNPISSVDFLDRSAVLQKPYASKFGTVQVFIFSFLCQSCKLIPEVFIVRRDGLKLSLSGRAPIEHVEVPKPTPKKIRDFYSGAVIAHQSGQTLAGNFLLRTLLEQWAREVTGLKANKDADKVIEAYMGKLPENFKSSFPSMKELYGKLSADIHAAVGSPELFGSSIGLIDEHFSARKLFKLDG